MCKQIDSVISSRKFSQFHRLVCAVILKSYNKHFNSGKINCVSDMGWFHKNYVGGMREVFTVWIKWNLAVKKVM